MPPADPSYRPDPPATIRRPVLEMTWATLTFLHWAYPPEEVQALLPPGLTVQTWRGQAWVGLVPFDMTVGPPGLTRLPWLSRFPETNVRTYAAGADRRTGVWFLSLDAARLPAVLAARIGWGLPYFWSTMRVARSGDTVRYDSVRLAHPTRRSRAGAYLHAEVARGRVFTDAELDGFDHFLTARFALWAWHAGRLWYSRADHPRWPLRRAELIGLDTSLLAAVGLRAPLGDPVVHYADGVRVRVAAPMPLRRRPGSANPVGCRETSGKPGRDV